MSQYDASRVAIWKRYYDTCQLKSPGSYVYTRTLCSQYMKRLNCQIMECCLWGNANFNFSEASMGYVATSNFEGYLHTARGWSKPYLVGYMESHDEERMMYKNLQFGNTSNTAHNVRDLNTALKTD